MPAPTAKTNTQKHTGTGQPVLWLSAILIALFSGLTLLFPSTFGAGLTTTKDWTLNQFDWLFAVTPVAVLIMCTVLAFSPLGQIRLGGAKASPDFGLASWIAMLFAAGVGIGFMFYGAAEPLAYYTNWFGTPLNVEAGSNEARRFAFSATIFHWGIAPWAVYAIMGLSLGFFAYNKGLPLTIRSAFYPLIGDRIWGWQGHLIDLFAVVSTVFGLATTIGLGAIQTSSGLAFLLDLEVGLSLAIAVIFGISVLAAISVLRGVDRGVKWLSHLNMILAIGLLVFVIIAGPTLAMAKGLMNNLAYYVADIPRLTNWIGRTDETWFHGWTIFYWAWWISWSPFVGMFIARISKGRTIREYLSTVIIVPTVIAIIWFTVFGETAISQFEANTGDLANGMDTAALTLFQMLGSLPFSELTSIVAMILLIVFIVTSADSGALVIEGMTTSKVAVQTKRWRVFWVLMLGITSASLLVLGGESTLKMLQAGTIVAALPFTFIVLASGISLFLGLTKTSGATP